MRNVSQKKPAKSAANSRKPSGKKSDTHRSEAAKQSEAHPEDEILDLLSREPSIPEIITEIEASIEAWGDELDRPENAAANVLYNVKCLRAGARLLRKLHLGQLSTSTEGASK